MIISQCSVCFIYVCRILTETELILSQCSVCFIYVCRILTETELIISQCSVCFIFVKNTDRDRADTLNAVCALFMCVGYWQRQTAVSCSCQGWGCWQTSVGTMNSKSEVGLSHLSGSRPYRARHGQAFYHMPRPNKFRGISWPHKVRDTLYLH